MNSLIIGSGAYGTAIAKKIKENGKTNLTIYGVDSYELECLSKGNNNKYFNDLKLPKFNTTNNIKEALKDKDYIFLAIPSFAIEKIIESIKKYCNKNFYIVVLSKGYINKTSKFISDFIDEQLQSSKLYMGLSCILGPSFAIEMIQDKITGVNIVSKKHIISKKIKAILETKNFIIKEHNDFYGCQIGSIFKNVIAIGCGIADAKSNESMNYKTFITQEAINDLIKIQTFFKNDKYTIFSLSNIGDIILTAFSNKSRNYTYGKNFYNEKDKKATVEGLESLKIYYRIGKKNSLNLNFINWLYKEIYE